MAFERSKEIARSFKRELIVYQRVLRDERIPLPAKWFLALAIGYFCMPFDLIPDFIPVIGHLDDAIVIPALVFAALRLVPREIVSEHRKRVIREQAATNGKGLNCATTDIIEIS
jgi:uncharacterized membrane protein YkvA (DUF1232 family)